MKVILFILFPISIFGQNVGRVSVYNLTKLNTFRVSIYENEVRRVTVKLPPDARISIGSQDDKIYKVKVTNLTNISEEVNCGDCYHAPRDKWGRAIIPFDADFQITVEKLKIEPKA